MKAVILCAGYGERLRPLTDILPKPLFPILGRPLLDNIIYYLRSHLLKEFTVDEICINTHWLAEKIHSHLGDWSRFGIKLNISHEPEILGVAGGIGSMREFLDEIFIVHNGDVLTNLDIKPAIDFHNKEAPVATLILHNEPKFNNVMVARNEIINIGNRLTIPTTPHSLKLAFTGLAIMSQEIFKFLPHKKPGSIIDVYTELISSHPGSLKAYVSKSHYWADIGTIESYLSVHYALLIDKIPALTGIAPPQENIYVGKDSSVSPLAKLTGFISIGNDCKIEDYAELKNCVVWDNVKISKGRKAENTVVYE